MTHIAGATTAEWAHFDTQLGWGAHLLPCVPAQDGLAILPASALNGKVGKIPSVFNAEGYAHGMTGWTKRTTTPEEVAAWARDGRYNICVRTGHLSRVYALDIDVGTESTSNEIFELLDEWMPDFPYRGRANSNKFLVPFTLPGDSACRKRLIKLDPKRGGERIELLADGQQFVCAGVHSSGARYEWSPGLPSSIPALTPTRMDALWQLLAQRYSVEPITTSTPEPSGGPSSSQNQTADDPIRTEISDGEWQDLLGALRSLLDKVSDNDTWSQIGYALLSLAATRPARQLWIDFSRKAAGFAEGAPEQWWDAHESQVPRSDYRHIFTLARAHGWGRVASAGAFPTTAGGVGSGNGGSNSDGASGPVGGDAGAGDLLPPSPEKPICRVTADNLPFLMDQCTDLLYDELYVHGNQLTRVGAASLLQDGNDRELDQEVFIRTITPEWIQDRLGRLAIWQKFNQRQGAWVLTNCPYDVARGFWKLSGWRLRQLDAIATAPFMREDGSLCDTPGYDARSRTQFIPNAVFPSIPASLTKGDAAAAADRLLRPFIEFPYATDGARSAYLAHLLTEVGRLSIGTAPMFWYTAPLAGIGKSLLSDMPSLIASGHLPPKRSWPRSEEELRKQLFAALLAGDRSLLFDNVPKGHMVRTVELCALLTSPRWADRVLGASQNIVTQNRMVLVATGNQITPAADLARRSLVIKLEPPREGIKDRRFQIEDLRAYITEHRVELLMDALTVLLAFNQYQPEPGEFPTLVPSFEDWSKRIRNAILWLGYPDPMQTQEEETDDEESNSDAAFGALAPSFAGPFTASDVTRLAASNDEINRVLLEAGCDAPYDSKKVGFWLRDNRDRVVGNWKLRRRRSVHNTRVWEFVKLDSGDLA